MTGGHDCLYRLSDDRLICLVHSKLKNVGGSKSNSGSSEIGTDVFVSRDDGRKWTKATRSPLFVPDNPSAKHECGLWETAIAEYEPGKLLMLGRTATGWAY